MAGYVDFQTRAAAHASVNERAEFLRLTYLHLAGAVLLTTAVAYGLVNSAFAPWMLTKLAGSQFSWLVVLGLFGVVSFVAQRWAAQPTNQAMQYVGLGLYAVAEAVIFVPLLFIAAFYSDPKVLPTAAVMTLVVFGGLTASVFITKKDFSFMGRALQLAGFAAFGIIVAAILFGFSLGTLFAGAMILLMSGYILYYTSNVLHHYPVGAHVAAALALYSALATLFWYVLRFTMGGDRD
ncbi:MAG: Bax inhibitor-1/YccA family protein [Myxococcales bacterium]|nr:Bax inhibitor-1/YccA family protein [Myxococcales bacterium]MCB9525908.1 Bax inhibitor-1 family protein [Myxococcales bacterium]